MYSPGRQIFEGGLLLNNSGWRGGGRMEDEEKGEMEFAILRYSHFTSLVKRHLSNIDAACYCMRSQHYSYLERMFITEFHSKKVSMIT